MDLEARTLLLRALVFLPIGFFFWRRERRAWRAWQAAKHLPTRGRRHSEFLTRARRRGDAQWRRKFRLLTVGIVCAAAAMGFAFWGPVSTALFMTLWAIAMASFLLYGWLSAPALPDDVAHDDRE